jgi:hypothetical protein
MRDVLSAADAGRLTGERAGHCPAPAYADVRALDVLRRKAT